MAKIKTAPNIESASVTARVISRLLKKSGFLMADTRDRYNWTEGFHVHRAGYSRHVIIGYYSKQPLNHSDRKEIAERREARKKIRKFLEERGYVFGQNDAIACNDV